MYTLLSFPRFASEPSSSPFCTKAMICLNLAGVDWQADFEPDLAILPHGKLPVLRDGDALIPDSNGIVAILEERGADLFPGLDRIGRVHAHAVIRMLEENLRMALVYSRWLHDDAWTILKPLFFASVPEPARDQVADDIRGKISLWCEGHGVARASDADRMAFFARDLEALETLLDGQDWLFGDQPTAVDASALPMLSALDTLPLDTDIRRAVRDSAVLQAYLTRGRARLMAPLTVLSSAAA